MDIRLADLADEAVRNLIRFHHEDMHASSPAGQAFAFDVDRLKAPGITVLAAYLDDELVGVGAVKVRDAEAELKSMRTVPSRGRSGVGSMLLAALSDTARGEGATVLTLETGSGAAFASASAFYVKHGFLTCGPFADYEASDFNCFMIKVL